MKSKYSILLLILLFGIAAVNAQNIVVDSSLESHNSAGCDYNNTDIAFNSHYSNVNSFAYNNPGEVDIIKSTSCIGENPPVGATALGLAHNGPLDRYDQISLNLTTPIVSGLNYDLTFWVDVLQYTTQAEGKVEFGISNSSNTFGTLWHTAYPVLAGGYVQLSTTITAPIGGNYLTIRAQEDNSTTDRTWIHIDGIELIGEPLPFCDVASVNTDTMIMPVDTLSDFTLASETDIILTGSILAGSGADTFVDLRAGNSIVLNGPFTAELGTRTLLYIADCDPVNLFHDGADDLKAKRTTNEHGDLKEEEYKYVDYTKMTPPFK